MASQRITRDTFDAVVQEKMKRYRISMEQAIANTVREFQMETGSSKMDNYNSRFRDQERLSFRDYPHDSSNRKWDTDMRRDSAPNPKYCEYERESSGGLLSDPVLDRWGSGDPILKERLYREELLSRDLNLSRSNWELEHNTLSGPEPGMGRSEVYREFRASQGFERDSGKEGFRPHGQGPVKPRGVMEILAAKVQGGQRLGSGGFAIKTEEGSGKKLSPQKKDVPIGEHEFSGQIVAWAKFNKMKGDSDLIRQHKALFKVETETCNMTMNCFKGRLSFFHTEFCFSSLKPISHPALNSPKIDNDLLDLLVATKTVSVKNDFFDAIKPFDKEVMILQQRLLKCATPLVLACNTFELKQPILTDPKQLLGALDNTMCLARKSLVLLGQTFALATALRQNNVMEILGIGGIELKPSKYPNFNDSFLFGKDFMTKLREWLRRSGHKLTLKAKVTKETTIKQETKTKAESEERKSADPNVVATIDQLLEYAKKEDKGEGEKPPFWFLFDKNSSEYKYYHQKLEEFHNSTGHGDTRNAPTTKAKESSQELSVESVRAMLYARKALELKRKLFRSLTLSKKSKAIKPVHRLSKMMKARRKIKLSQKVGKKNATRDMKKENVTQVVQEDNVTTAAIKGTVTPVKQETTTPTKKEAATTPTKKEATTPVVKEAATTPTKKEVTTPVVKEATTMAVKEVKTTTGVKKEVTTTVAVKEAATTAAVKETAVKDSATTAAIKKEAASTAAVKEAATTATVKKESATTAAVKEAAVKKEAATTAAVKKEAATTAAVKKEAATTAAVKKEAATTAAVKKEAATTAAVKKEAATTAAVKKEAATTAAVKKEATTTAAVKKAAATTAAVKEAAVKEATATTAAVKETVTASAVKKEVTTAAAKEVATSMAVEKSTTAAVKEVSTAVGKKAPVKKAASAPAVKKAVSAPAVKKATPAPAVKKTVSAPAVKKAAPASAVKDASTPVAKKANVASEGKKEPAVKPVQIALKKLSSTQVEIQEQDAPCKSSTDVTSKPLEKDQSSDAESSEDPELSDVDEKTKDTAIKLAQFVIQMGPEIEEFSMQNSVNNPDFWFLREKDSPAYQYYKSKLEEFKKEEASSDVDDADLESAKTGDEDMEMGAGSVSTDNSSVAAFSQMPTPSRPPILRKRVAKLKVGMLPPKRVCLVDEPQVHDPVRIDYERPKGRGNSRRKKPGDLEFANKKITQHNVGFQMLSKMGWQEGQGLGSGGSGIKNPIKVGSVSAGEGLGAELKEAAQSKDDNFDAFRQRMMTMYKQKITK
ncbi:SURP and G-patch domain-containing protein 2 [Mantella aurantiaca]